jgi:hypothetical protein
MPPLAKLTPLAVMLLTLGPPLLPASSAQEMAIDADYPGGNVQVIRREAHTFVVAPDLRDTRPGEWWFYWSFRLRGPSDLPVTIVFEQKNPIGVRGPTTSRDGGHTWTWLGDSAVRTDRVGAVPRWSFEARIPPGATEVRYAFAPPYQQANLQAWLDRHAGNPALRVEPLATSRHGRKVPLVRIASPEPPAPGSPPRGLVLLTSRHHACEMMATYALEGLLEAALADDETGRLWRDRWEIVAVPFVDLDGVEAGDQGKNRNPHDHNRDYNPSPLYPEVQALMKLGAAKSGRVVAAVDLHCPHIRGEWNDRVYLVGLDDPRVWAGQQAFGHVLERTRTGPLPFTTRDGLLPHGVAWNTSANTRDGRSFGQWAASAFPSARLVTTIEIAYADALGVEVTPVSARALGHDLLRAILEHLGPPAPQP